ncbi:hypothetical protein DFH29DRAFT_774043, partial [Suillus ampliporus]
PDSLTDPTSVGTWDLNNLCIITALHTCSTPEEGEFLCVFTNAHLAWNMLKVCHEKVGLIAQILLIQQVLATCFHHSEHLSTTSTQLSNLIWCICVIDLPKKVKFFTIMMLNDMTNDLLHIHNHIAGTIT